MTRILCNSCGATWEKPKARAVIVPHACPDTVIDQHSQCDPLTGNAVKPATFKAVQNPRNENFAPHPTERGEHVMVSEGLGVSEIE